LERIASFPRFFPGAFHLEQTDQNGNDIGYCNGCSRIADVLKGMKNVSEGGGFRSGPVGIIIPAQK
jgi:hypothetical protein